MVMKRVLAGLVLSKAQYRELVGGCVAKNEFPSWADWNKQQIMFAADPKRVGGYPEPWTLDVGQFQEWCRNVGTVACSDALCAYSHHLQGHRVEIQASLDGGPSTGVPAHGSP
jgi:hypothetical protein